jgi:uncharacterized protein (TIGR03437 family)
MVQISWGDCTYDGTNTTCTVSGPFTGLGGSGTYSFVLTYAGNGPSTLTGTVQSTGSNFVTFHLSQGSFTDTFQVTGGPTVSFQTQNFDVLYSSPTCTGGVTTCSVNAVASTVGATISGPVNGSFNPTPNVQTAISAGQYGGFASIAPATWIEIYGTNLATATGAWGSSNFNGNDAPTTLGGTSVTVGGQSAFVNYVSPGQVNVQVPSNVATGQQPVIVTTIGGASNAFSANVNATEPGLLAPPSFDINGTQYAVALFPTQFYVLPPGAITGLVSKRAQPGDTIMLYGIGFGPVTPDNPAGVIDQGTNQINATLSVSIGGQSAQVAYAGLTPGFVGLYQFNVVVPNVPASDKTPLTFTLNGTPGAQTLYLAIAN